MQARIYQPVLSAMQSGKGKRDWVFEFDRQGKDFIEPLMGWTGTEDPTSQIKLKFATKEEAINYAKKQNIPFQLIEPQQAKLHIRSYDSNFLPKAE